MATVERFEDLEIWKQAKNMAVFLWKITNEKEWNYSYSLKDQIRRSALSVSSNIAEGFGRNGNKEFVQFLSMAKGSLYELKSQLYVAAELKLIAEVDIQSTIEYIEQIAKMISGLTKYLQNSEYKGSKFKEDQAPYQNFEPKTSNLELRTSNPKLRTSNLELRTSNLEPL